jgi:proteasome assembly chaperone (PAC2) family protein
MEPGPGATPDAPHLRWGERPELYRPTVVAAFEGWNDAGDAATAAVSYLHEQWDARVVGDIDPEEFFDFTATRPRVEFDEHDARRIIWPANEVSVAVIPTTGRDVVLIRGVEPQLRWRTFTQHVLAVAETFGADLVVTVGALLAEVPHSRPVSVFGAAYDPVVVAELGLSESRYEGPTGIVGVLHAACYDAEMRSASLWAAVPTYVPSAPSPKAALALVERICLLLDTSVDTTPLELAAASYERQVSELVAEDDETEEYVEALEQRYDHEIFGDPTSLVEQVERFLRDQRD